MITQQEVKELLTYDPETGICTYKPRLLSRNRLNVYANMQAGYDHGSGYLSIGINYKTYLLHRIIWLYVYGELPTREIDHINGDRKDNRLCNLRLATRSQNSMNTALRIDSTTKIKGLSFDNRYNRYQAYVNKDGKRKTKSFAVNNFRTKEQAKQLAITWLERTRKELHDTFACNVR